MVTNKLIMKISFITIIIVTILSCITIRLLTVDKPVFLKNYIDSHVNINGNNIYNTDFSKIKYITNINDKRKVVGIEFPELPNINFTASEDVQSTFSFMNVNTQKSLGENYGRYCIKTVYITIEPNQPVNNLLNKSIKYAIILFDNGESLSVDLGKILFFYDNKVVFRNNQSSSSNNGISSNTYILQDNITITKIESEQLELNKELFKLEMDGNPFDKIIGSTLNMNESVVFTQNFPIPENLTKRYTTYIIKPILYYKDADGKTNTTRIANINYEPQQFKFSDLIKYLNDRGVK